MKKAIAIIVAVIIVAGGAYAIFHKSSPSSSSTASGQNSAPAVNNSVLITKTNSSLGQYLADPSGHTLYTYNADSKGASNCTGSCLAAWPAYVDKGSTTNLPAGVGTIKRTDNGQVQYTYNGLPLYYFAGEQAGQVTGNGVQNFSVARPAASSSSSSSSSNSSSSGSSQPSQTPSSGSTGNSSSNSYSNPY